MWSPTLWDLAGMAVSLANGYWGGRPWFGAVSTPTIEWCKSIRFLGEAGVTPEPSVRCSFSNGLFLALQKHFAEISHDVGPSLSLL
jgi:hypothetical protein